MILLRRRNRLGNILFQYCFARVLAQRLNYRLAAAPVRDFAGTRAVVEGEEVFGPATRWQGQWPFDALVGRPIERGELSMAPGARVTLDGWFQQFEFIADVRDDVREDWLRLDDPHPPRPSRDFAICLRFGNDAGTPAKADDPKAGSNMNCFLRENEVRRLAGQVPHERLFLVTDQPRHPQIEALRDLRAEIVSGSEMERFRFTHSCQKVAIGQETTGWWAAFLGVAREVYFPPIDQGPWSHPEPAKFAYDPEHYGIDLRVTDDERWIYDWWK